MEFLAETLDPELQLVENVYNAKDDTDDGLKVKLSTSDFGFIPKSKLTGTRDQSGEMAEMMRNLDEEGDSPSQYLARDFKLPKLLDLQADLKRIRLFLEQQHESSPGSVPRDVVNQLATYELTFYIERDSSTDSIWNIEHQELLYEVFEKSDEGVAYRQKCICQGGGWADHSLDIYCPRNITDTTYDSGTAENDGGSWGSWPSDTQQDNWQPDTEQLKKQSGCQEECCQQGTWNPQEDVPVAAVEEDSAKKSLQAITVRICCITRGSFSISIGASIIHYYFHFQKISMSHN
jgi:hypothetical protein